LDHAPAVFRVGSAVHLKDSEDYIYDSTSAVAALLPRKRIFRETCVAPLRREWSAAC